MASPFSRVVPGSRSVPESRTGLKYRFFVLVSQTTDAWSAVRGARLQFLTITAKHILINVTGLSGHDLAQDSNRLQCRDVLEGQSAQCPSHSTVRA